MGGRGSTFSCRIRTNRRIIEECAANLGIPAHKVIMNVDRYGNTSAASIPIAISEAWASGGLNVNHRLLLLAFGAGYTWAGATLRWTLPYPSSDLGTARAPGAAAALQA